MSQSDLVLDWYRRELTKIVRRMSSENIDSSIAAKGFTISSSPSIRRLVLSGWMGPNGDYINVSCRFTGTSCSRRFSMSDPKSLPSCRHWTKSIVGRWRLLHKLSDSEINALAMRWDI